MGSKKVDYIELHDKTLTELPAELIRLLDGANEFVCNCPNLINLPSIPGLEITCLSS